MSLSFVSIISAYGFGNSFDSLFSAWEQGDIAPNIAKIVFSVLIVFFIYALLENFRMIKNAVIRWVLSILISFLATMYLAPEEVYAMLVSYSALGLTLGSLVPFLILAGFTFSAIKSGEPTQIILQWIAWIMFAAFMVYRSIMVFIYERANVSVTVTAILLGMAIVALFMVLFNKQIIGIIAKKYFAAEISAGRMTTNEATDMIKDLAKMRRETSQR